MFDYKNLDKYKELLDDGFYLGYNLSEVEWIKMFKRDDDYVFELEDDGF